MNLSDNPRIRLFTLCALYVAQGIPFGFVTIAMAPYLAEQGMGEEAIGWLQGLVSLPWAFKWIWGPVIDGYGLPAMGRRRPWILLAQLLMAGTIAAMIAIPDVTAELVVLGAMILIHNVFSSLQDVSVDALAVDLLREEERGRANGLMYGSSYFGSFLGGAGLGAVLSLFDFRVALVVQVVLLLAIMMIPLLLRERRGERLLPWSRGRSMAPVEARTAGSAAQVFKMLAKAFSLPSTQLSACVAVLVRIGGGALTAASVVYFIQQLDWTKEQYTGVSGGLGVWLGLGGSILGGFLADRVGPRRLAGVATILLGLTWIAFALLEPWWSENALVISVILADVLFTGVLSVSLFAMFMTVSWPAVAATQFTAYMALMNLSNTIGSWLAGPLCRVMSLAQMYLWFGLAQIALIGLLLAIDPHQARRILGGKEGEPP